MFINHETRETSDKRLLIMQNSICKRRETSDERLFIMQNKAKLQNTEMNVTSLLTKSSENFRNFSRLKNKAKQSQNKANFSPKLGSFFPKLALFYKETFAFANNFILFAGLQMKNAEHSCGRERFYGKSLLFGEKSFENTQVSEINPCQSVKSVAKKFSVTKSIICDNLRKSAVNNCRVNQCESVKSVAKFLRIEAIKKASPKGGFHKNMIIDRQRTRRIVTSNLPVSAVLHRKSGSDFSPATERYCPYQPFLFAH